MPQSIQVHICSCLWLQLPVEAGEVSGDKRKGSVTSALDNYLEEDKRLLTYSLEGTHLAGLGHGNMRPISQGNICSRVGALAAWFGHTTYLDQLFLCPLAVYTSFSGLTSEAAGDVEIRFAGYQTCDSHMWRAELITGPRLI
jgi:hypothetical protein